MAKRKKKETIPPELQAELDARYDETTRRLEERIAYHRAKIAEERERKQSRFWRYRRTET
jgi:hypothetical protein